jgi:AcrR family transcriptional regulator
MLASKRQANGKPLSRPGRPRDPGVEARILKVTLRLLAEWGYTRMTLDDIAAQANASKSTVYRRWSGKADLATAAVRTLQLKERDVNTGTTAGDLTGILQNFRRSLLRPNGMSLIGAVLAEEKHSPELLALFRERLVAPRRRMLLQVLERARARGELRHDADLEASVNLLVGAFYARYLQQSDVSAEYPAQLVSTVWEGVRRR